MKLPPEIHQQLVGWVKEGLSLSDIQKSLEAAGFKMTYMEVRFLIDDLEIDLPAAPAEEPVAEEEDLPQDEDLPEAGTVSVEIDSVVRPGAVVSGSVTFSDGVHATWALDQTGRMMLDAGRPGYQPPVEDIPAFQNEIRKALQGF